MKRGNAYVLFVILFFVGFTSFLVLKLTGYLPRTRFDDHVSYGLVVEKVCYNQGIEWNKCLRLMEDTYVED